MYDTKIKSVYVENTPEYYLNITEYGVVSATDILKAMTASTPIDLSIPSEMNGIKVKVINDGAFMYCESLTSINIPNSVTRIGSGAFVDCRLLRSITIPEGVTKIDNSTFSGCSSLTSITIPNSVTNIINYAFNHCTSLTSITIPERVAKIDNNAFYGCTSLTEININKPTNSITGSPWGATKATVNWLG